VPRNNERSSSTQFLYCLAATTRARLGWGGTVALPLLIEFPPFVPISAAGGRHTMFGSTRYRSRSSAGWQDYARAGFGRADYRASAAAYAFDAGPALSRAERVARLDALATLLDTAILIPGTNIRFGLDALIGLVPGIGDVITTALSLYIVHEARVLGAPGLVIARMLGNVALDGVVGAVPLLGDAFDVLWRANKRNMRLLQEWIRQEEARVSRR